MLWLKKENPGLTPGLKNSKLVNANQLSQNINPRQRMVKLDKSRGNYGAVWRVNTGQACKFMGQWEHLMEHKWSESGKVNQNPRPEKDDSHLREKKGKAWTSAHLLSGRAKSMVLTMCQALD